MLLQFSGEIIGIIVLFGYMFSFLPFSFFLVFTCILWGGCFSFIRKGDDLVKLFAFVLL